MLEHVLHLLFIVLVVVGGLGPFLSVGGFVWLRKARKRTPGVTPGLGVGLVLAFIGSGFCAFPQYADFVTGHGAAFGVMPLFMFSVGAVVGLVLLGLGYLFGEGLEAEFAAYGTSDE